MASSKTLQNFYASDRWRHLRSNLILERGNKCHRCNKSFPSPSLIGHHIIPLTIDNIEDVNISLNQNNIEIICIDCHNEEHNRFNQQEQKVYIVYGSPCSGKSTYVNQHYNYGDMIIDIDRLWLALSNECKYKKPNELKQVVLSTYDYLIDCVKVRKGNWKNCFIVGSFANQIKRERLSKELNAELIFINETKEKCLNNLYNDKERKEVVNEWKLYIEKWFEDFV